MTRPKVKATRRLHISATVRAASTSFLQRAVRWAELPCRGEDPELFFPSGDPADQHQQIKQAKKVCASCPLRMTCLELTVRAEAAKRAPLHGIFGGKTADERTPEVTARRAKAEKAKRKAAPKKPIITASLAVAAVQSAQSATAASTTDDTTEVAA